MLAKGYPASKFVPRAHEALAALAAVVPAAPSAQQVPPNPVVPAVQQPRSDSSAVPVATAGPAQGITLLKSIHRTALADGVRLIVDLDNEVGYHQEEIANPRRLFFDLKGVKTVPNLQDVSLKFEGDVVKEVRLGRHPQNTTRLVVDIEGIAGYTVYPLYGPYRLVIDLRRATAAMRWCSRATY